MGESQSEWQSRLSEMEDWYAGLAADEVLAAQSLHQDYEPYSAFLGSLQGEIVDVGGGAGLASGFLKAASRYVVVDPSETWLDPKWDAIRAAMGPGQRPEFHVGVGEALPLGSDAFDAALLFWSLNHARDPEAVMAEVARVTRPGGQVLCVLEDMEPGHAEVAMAGLSVLARRLSGGRLPPTRMPQIGGGTMVEILRGKYGGRGWPVQSDHLRIGEAAFRRWIAPGFRVVERRWRSGFLAYVLEAR